MSERQTKIEELSEEIEDINKRIQFKQKQIEVLTPLKKFNECHQLQEECMELKKTSKERSRVLDDLKARERKSAWYYAKKKQTPSDISQVDQPSLPDQSNESSESFLR